VSEYQYYEFQAIDRPLTAEEMAELRRHSSRARITPTSFVNDYAWGSLRGSVDAWMERYFDAFLYLANWGTRSLQLRLPARLLSPETARSYCPGRHAAMRTKAGMVILSFTSTEEEGGSWIEGDGRLAALQPLRAELVRGDLRALYLGWRAGVASDGLADDDVEPPVPAGLAEPSASLTSFAELLRLDPDLVAVAAAASPPLPELTIRAADARAWLATLATAEKDELLAQMIAGDAVLAEELAQRVRRERASGGATDATAPRRSVAELRRAAEVAAVERRRREAAAAAKERTRAALAAAAARRKHLDALAGTEPALWQRVVELIAKKSPKSYDEAVASLLDLRDLAARAGDAGFRGRVAELCAMHARRPRLLERLEQAGL
jgi:hypothetical protein